MGELHDIAVEITKTVAYKTTVGPTAGPFANYRTWTGPRSVWTGDDSTVSTWGALA